MDFIKQKRGKSVLICAALLVAAAIAVSFGIRAKNKKTEALPDTVRNYFVAVAKNDSELSMILTVTYNETQKKITAEALPTDAAFAVENGTSDYADVYAAGGFDKLQTCVSEQTGTEFAKHAYLTDNAFIECCSFLGVVEVSVPEDVSHVYGDTVLYLTGGVQRITGADLLAYMKYGAPSADAAAHRTKLANKMLKAYICEENIIKGDELFTNLVNLCDTDITVFDYTNALPVLKEIMADSGYFAAEDDNG